MSKSTKKISKNNIRKKFIEAKNKNDFGEISEILSDSFLSDPSYIALVEDLEGDFIKNNLDKEIIELYRMEFCYTSEPLILERIGDIYYKIKNYDSALNSYFDCAELSDNYYQIYKKLADTFSKLGDTKSMQTCLEHYNACEERK